MTTGTPYVVGPAAARPRRRSASRLTRNRHLSELDATPRHIMPSHDGEWHAAEPSNELYRW
jgi:hypothetical protein